MLSRDSKKRMLRSKLRSERVHHKDQKYQKRKNKRSRQLQISQFQNGIRLQKEFRLEELNQQERLKMRRRRRDPVRVSKQSLSGILLQSHLSSQTGSRSHQLQNEISLSIFLRKRNRIRNHQLLSEISLRIFHKIKKVRKLSLNGIHHLRILSNLSNKDLRLNKSLQ